jgi:hypothetical protein
MKMLLILAVALASCSKELPEPRPTDKRMQEQVRELQGWEPKDVNCSCQIQK